MVSHSAHQKVAMDHKYNPVSAEFQRKNTGSPYNSIQVINEQYNAYKDSEEGDNGKNWNKTDETWVIKESQKDVNLDHTDRLDKSNIN